MDFEWYRRIAGEVPALWLRHAVRDNGLFHPSFDRRWNPEAATKCTLVSQSRLIYNFCRGFELTGEAGFLDAAVAGGEALFRYFRDDDRGGWYFACDGAGRVTDHGKDMYGHAFVIFAFAHLARVTREPRWLEGAWSTLETVKRRFTDSHGGPLRRLDRDFCRSDPGPRSQNPAMHLFEALLALGQIEPPALAAALEVYDILVSLFLRPDGLLPEYFTEDWRELPAAAGGGLWPGHAFEWAFLLSRAVELGLPADLLQTAARLLQFGVDRGIDSTDGGVFSRVSPDLTAASGKGWWEQCEAIRALLHFVLRRGRRDLRASLENVRSYADKHLLDHEFGGWRADAEGRKGSPWKVDYHVVAMGMEALRLENGEQHR